MATKSRKVKAPKDMHAPKKNLSGYFIFTNERRVALKLAHPDKKITALTTLMAAEWKSMDAETKQGYLARSDADKASYTAAMAEYKKTENFSNHQLKLSAWKEEQKLTADKTAAKKPKDVNAPKKSATGYFIFTARIRKETTEANPTMKITDIAKLMGQKWTALPEEEKKKYLDEAARLKEEHKVAVAEYEKSDLFAAYQQKVAAWKAEQSMKREQERVSKLGPQAQSDHVKPKVSYPRKPKDSNAPKKALSGFMLFSNSARPLVRSEHPELKMTQIAKVLGMKWKALPEEESTKWADLAAKQKAEYQIALAQYKETENYKTFESTMAQWKAECERRESKADALFVKKMQMLSTKASTATATATATAKSTKSKKQKMGKSMKKKRRYYSDSDSSSYSSDSSSGSYSSDSSSGSYSSSSSYSD